MGVAVAALNVALINKIHYGQKRILRSDRIICVQLCPSVAVPSLIPNIPTFLIVMDPHWMSALAFLFTSGRCVATLNVKATCRLVGTFCG
jgi:hypothetical protein